MFSMFRRNKPPGPVSSPHTVPGPMTMPPPPDATPQNPDVQRELVRVVLKNILRKHGIPSEWVTCEVFQITRSSGRLEPIVELVLRVWNQQLLLHTNALARQMAEELVRFDPVHFRAGRAVSWRIATDCKTPYDQFPDPSTWTKLATADVTPQPIPILDRRKTPRPKDAPVYDRRPSDSRDGDGFEATAVTPLR